MPIYKSPRQKYSKLRRTDNNGQLSSDGENWKNVGPCALSNTIGNDNIRNLSKCCDVNDLVARRAFPAPENKDAVMMGNMQKQIDDIHIHERYSNCVKLIDIAENANSLEKTHREALIFKIKIKLKSEYFVNPRKDNFPYDIEKIRGNPEKLKM